MVLKKKYVKNLLYFSNLFPMKKTYALASISILFLRDVLFAWRKLYKIYAILCFGQEIIWNNTHMYKTWYDQRYIRDIYDYIMRRYFAL